MRQIGLTALLTAVLWFAAAPGFAAYHHEGEKDAAKFLSVYPEKAGTKLDHCATCHSGGSYVNNKGKTVSLGSCQWCHENYGYNGAGNIADTMNAYGSAFKAAGRTPEAVQSIENDDSDGDGYTNAVEIAANRFPGDATDDPTKVTAPYRVYTREQLAAMAQHKQFLLMNTSRSGDFYAEYSGVPIKALLDDAGITSSATGIKVYAPDGWSQYHPLEYDAAIEMYHVYGNVPGEDYQYPPATYAYDLVADQDQTPDDGWCDYSAPSCVGRSHGDSIFVTNGLKAILALRREGVNLDTGVLNNENKLDGEGPFRVVVPQKFPEAPDQSSNSTNQNVIWPYENMWDHNAGACSRSATIIKVEPLPAGTTDINILEAGWSYVDANKIIVYGAIDDTDSNGNGILDSEEGNSDPDPKKARVRHAKGTEHVAMESDKGAFKNVESLMDDDPGVPQKNKPAGMSCPFGTTKFDITGLIPGESVDITLVYPNNVPTTAKYYKIDATNGWHEIPMGSNDGDDTIIITLTDGDPLTDADGAINGTIVDPGAVVLPVSSVADSGGGSGCFIAVTTLGSPLGWLSVTLLISFGLLTALGFGIYINRRRWLR